MAMYIKNIEMTSSLNSLLKENNNDFYGAEKPSSMELTSQDHYCMRLTQNCEMFNDAN